MRASKPFDYESRCIPRRPESLRQIIEADVRNPAYLLNVRGTGYRLVAD